MLELSLARQLRQWKPDFEIARVDLSPFPKVQAKIDCLTINGGRIIPKTEIAQLGRVLSGAVRQPNNRPKTASIHDPTQEDLRYLLKNYPDFRVDRLEIAVDAFLPVGSNDLYLLRQLKEQLRHCIAPCEHEHFTNTERVYWNLDSNRRSHDPVSRPAPLTTITYKATTYGLDLKIYLKTIDQDTAASEYCLRTELALSGAGGSWAGLDTVADLPRFGRSLRTYASKAFFIGRGFKQDDTARTKWQKYGAAWTFGKEKGLEIQPDADANRRYGDALNNLGRALQRVEGN